MDEDFLDVANQLFSTGAISPPVGECLAEGGDKLPQTGLLILTKISWQISIAKNMFR